MPPKRKTVPKENIPPKREKLQEEIPSKKPDDKPKAEELPKVAKEDNVPVEESTVDDDAGAELSDKLVKRFDEQPPGKLLIAGLVTWELTGGPKAKPVSNVRPNLYSFHRFTSEMYRSAVTGCCSAHSVLITMDRKALAFGRNQHGQLGQSDLRTFEKPTPVNGLKDVKVIQAACGRNHTLFLTDNGVVYACGDNRHGQCGVGHTIPSVLKATRLKYMGPPIGKVACGAEFSIILDINGRLYSFGLPEHGQLGHNTDGKYFITANRLAYHYETVPRQIVTFVEKTNEGRTIPIEDVQILDFACGNNHTNDAARAVMLQQGTCQNVECYRQKQKHQTRLFQEKKRRQQETECEETELLQRTQETRKFYQKLNGSRRGFVPRAEMCRVKDGNILSDGREVIERRKQHYGEHLHGAESTGTEVQSSGRNDYVGMFDNSNQPAPTLREVKGAVHQLKNNNAAGKDGIEAELIKMGPEKFVGSGFLPPECFQTIGS